MLIKPVTPIELQVATPLLYVNPDFYAAGNVATLNDSSGRRVAFSGTGSAQPVNTANRANGHNAIVFDGSNDTLQGSSSASLFNVGDMTLFIVARKTSDNGSNSRLFNVSNNADRIRFNYYTASNDVTFISSSDGSGGVNKTLSDVSAWHIICGSRTGNTVSLKVNNGTASTATNSATPIADAAQFAIGDVSWFSANYFPGDLALLVLYGEYLSTTKQTALHAEFSRRYGIAIS